MIELLEFSSQRGMLVDARSIMLVQPRKRWSLITMYNGEKVKVAESVAEIQSEVDEELMMSNNLGSIMEQIQGAQQ